MKLRSALAALQAEQRIKLPVRGKRPIGSSAEGLPHDGLIQSFSFEEEHIPITLSKDFVSAPDKRALGNWEPVSHMTIR